MYEYLLNAISFFILAGIILHTYFWSRQSSNAVSKVLLLLGGITIIPGILYFLWFIRYINPIPGDALLLTTLFYVFLSSLTLVLMYKITGNSRIKFMYLLYAVALIGLLQTFEKFQFFVLIVSNLLLIILFLDSALFSKKYFRLASICGIAQSITAVLMSLFAWDLALQWWFIPNLLISGFFLFAYVDKERYSAIKKIDDITKPIMAPFQILFIKYLIYVFALIGFMTISTVAIHELGHGVVAKLSSCSYAKVVLFDFVNMPHTEILCDQGYDSLLIGLAGIIFTTIVAAIFWFSEPKFSGIASLLFSIGLLVSHRDFADIGLSQTALVGIQILAVVLVVLSITKIAVNYLHSSGSIENIEKEEHEQKEQHTHKALE